MLYFDRRSLSNGIDPAKSNHSKLCTICHYWFFNHGFKYQDSVCDGCHDLLMLCVNIRDISIVADAEVDYRCIIPDVRKSEAVHFLENFLLDQGWIQGSSSSANEEVAFPSSEIKKQAKRMFKRSLEVLSDNIFGVLFRNSTMESC